MPRKFEKYDGLNKRLAGKDYLSCSRPAKICRMVKDAGFGIPAYYALFFKSAYVLFSSELSILILPRGIEMGDETIVDEEFEAYLKSHREELLNLKK